MKILTTKNRNLTNLAAQKNDMEQASPLFSITYNPPGKGDSLTVAVGKDRAEREHVVAAPQELLVQSVAQEKGEVMEVRDKEGRHLSISLE